MRNSMKIRKIEDVIQDNLIVKMQTGSHAYGTSLPSSDQDFRGIFCADPVNIRTPFFPVREATDASEEDTKSYELVRFMDLYLGCNPNIVELLWTDDSDIIFRTPEYDFLREFRLELLSSKVAFTFSGYALAQLKRIKGHNKWINNPLPEAPPRQIDFVSLVQWFGVEKMLPGDFEFWSWRFDLRLVPYGNEIYGLYHTEGYQTYSADFTLNTTFEGGRHNLGFPLAVIKFNKEEYKLAHEKWEQYWTWKKNRNKVRADLEEKHLVDTKHASHLVRLLRMGVEVLRDGEVIVKRPDAQELLAIRDGAWSYEQIVQYAEEMDKEVREVWYKKTSLPKKPNVKLAAEILMKVQEMVWNRKKI